MKIAGDFWAIWVLIGGVWKLVSLLEHEKDAREVIAEYEREYSGRPNFVLAKAVAVVVSVP